jgi:hypothetical protein
MKMKRFAAFLGLALGLGGCANGEHAMPGGEPIGSYAFRYVALAHGSEIVSPEAEKRRLASLDQYVKEAQLCRNGYTVVMRSPEADFARADEPEDWMRYVLYLGMCRSAPTTL